MNIERTVNRYEEYINCAFNFKEADKLYYTLVSIRKENGGSMNETLQEMLTHLRMALGKPGTGE